MLFWLLTALLKNICLHSSAEKPEIHEYRYSRIFSNKLSVLWRCWLGSGKGIWPIKTDRRVAGMVICPERSANLHMAQLMPLPLTVSCFSKIQIGFSFLVPAHRGNPGKKGPLNVCYVFSNKLSDASIINETFLCAEWDIKLWHGHSLMQVESSTFIGRPDCSNCKKQTMK